MYPQLSQSSFKSSSTPISLAAKLMKGRIKSKIWLKDFFRRQPSQYLVCCLWNYVYLISKGAPIIWWPYKMQVTPLYDYETIFSINHINSHLDKMLNVQITLDQLATLPEYPPYSIVLRKYNSLHFYLRNIKFIKSRGKVVINGNCQQIFHSISPMFQ